DRWVTAGSVPTQLVDSAREIGPGVLLYDGRALFFGATGQTAIYDSPGSPLDPGPWEVGPVIPHGKKAGESPAAGMPNGHVLIAGSSGGFATPSGLFEFEPETNAFVSAPLPPWDFANYPVYIDRMLVLPTGQVILSDGYREMAIYTPSGGSEPGWKPTITS